MPGSTEAPSSYGIKNGARLAFLSTWNQPCGIATHTGYMIDGLKKAVGKDGGWLRDIFVCAEDAPPIAPDESWVVRSWSRHGDTFERVKTFLARYAVTHLHIQFQIGLYGNTDILGLAEYCRNADIKLYLTFHSSENGLPLCAALVNLSTRSFVHLEQSAMRFVAFGAESRKIQLVPHGIHDDKPQTSKEKARDKLGLSRGMKLITSFGFCEPHKGVYEIITALPAVVQRHPETVFIFLGGPHDSNPESIAYATKCRERAQQLGIGERVIFADTFLPDDIVSSYLFASDVIVMNYLVNRNEISGAAAFALAHRRPLITSATPAFRELADCTLQTSLDMPLETALCLTFERAVLPDYLVAQTENTWHGLHTRNSARC